MERYTTNQMLADFSVLRLVCGRHGLGVPRYLPGDVQHLVSPIVGMLRLGGPEYFTINEPISSGYLLERLSLVLAITELAAEDRLDAFVEDFENFLKSERKTNGSAG